MNNQALVAKTLHQALSEHLTYEQIENLLEKPKYAEHGDVAFPVFSLAKIFRKAPQQIATDLVAQLDTTGYEKVEVVGAYLNFFMDKAQVSSQVLQEVLTQKANFGSQNIGQNKQVPIDMSSPNIAKPMSMGHLR